MTISYFSPLQKCGLPAKIRALQFSLLINPWSPGVEGKKGFYVLNMFHPDSKG